MKVKYIQTFFTSAGRESCYADCLVMVAAAINKTEVTLESVGRAMDLGIDKGYIKFNQSNYLAASNFYVSNPVAFLKDLTGKRIDVVKETASYKCKPNEYEICFYVKNDREGSRGIGHFMFGKGPTQASETVRVGYVYSKRIVRVL